MCNLCMKFCACTVNIYWLCVCERVYMCVHAQANTGTITMQVSVGGTDKGQ